MSRGPQRIATALAVLLLGAGMVRAEAVGPFSDASIVDDMRSSDPLTGVEIVTLLREYLRIDTSNPPGNELQAARFFQDLFEHEGIAAEIYEFEPEGPTSSPASRGPVSGAD